jgi:acetyltransferase-like isoleucine patch superfamily enzyme
MDLILRIAAGLASRLRLAWLRARGVRIPGHVALRAVEIPRHPRSITLEPGVALDRGITLLATGAAARIVIGARVYMNRHTMLDASERIEIGADAMIGPFCYITDHDHAVKVGALPAEGALVSAPVQIGARCWLGAHVTVLKGVSIGEGTVVGAGSVVTKSLPPDVIAVGNPARVLKPVPA